uniref:Uncharacterized protein n=1 Tax=Ciona savignyi TaxID=51511 RepID=H2Y7H2_CIOSA
MNVCCTEYTITCGNTSLCPPPNCPVNHTAIYHALLKDPNTQSCCPLYACRCDVCVESNKTRTVGEKWQIDVGDGCMVTYECSPTQRKNLLTELESSGNCHKVIKISDPRQKCQSITFYEYTVCNSYQTAVERKYESDPDVCCPEFKCICKEGSKLQTACSSFLPPQCPPNMQIVKSGTVFNTTDCSP